MQQIFIDKHACKPSKIICVGRNYLEHINELNNEIPENMVLFFKPNSAISQDLQAEHSIKNEAESIHYEAEICFIYQHQRLAAVGIGLDLTKRALQTKLKEKGLPWERAKAFDGAALFSDFVSIAAISEQLELTLHIDGELAQHAHISHMMYSPTQILHEIQQFVTLQDGDIIMTGTPAGVGEIKRGSLYSCELKNADKSLITKQWLAI
ncbi:MAG: fumarylacetoacetate hydrolase family protein [Oceanospirillaceae bacterium]